MFRSTFLALTIALLLATTSCQTYSSGLQKSLVVADEAAATGVLRTVALAQQSYSATNSGSFATFQELVASGFLDARFNSEKPAFNNYAYTMEVTKDSYQCNADPTNAGAHPGRHFYIDSSNAGIHVNATQRASASDPESAP
jgi:hypothetical protein